MGLVTFILLHLFSRQTFLILDYGALSGRPAVKNRAVATDDDTNICKELVNIRCVSVSCCFRFRLEIKSIFGYSGQCHAFSMACFFPYYISQRIEVDWIAWNLCVTLFPLEFCMNIEGRSLNYKRALEIFILLSWYSISVLCNDRENEQIPIYIFFKTNYILLKM